MNRSSSAKATADRQDAKIATYFAAYFAKATKAKKATKVKKAGVVETLKSKF